MRRASLIACMPTIFELSTPKLTKPTCSHYFTHWGTLPLFSPLTNKVKSAFSLLASQNSHHTFDLSTPDIEQLTHKTGNFKEFNIFCNMLESGLKKVCVICYSSISCDLLWIFSVYINVLFQVLLYWFCSCVMDLKICSHSWCHIIVVMS